MGQVAEVFTGDTRTGEEWPVEPVGYDEDGTSVYELDGETPAPVGTYTRLLDEARIAHVRWVRAARRVGISVGGLPPETWRRAAAWCWRQLRRKDWNA